MRPPRLTEAADKDAVARLQVEDLERDAARPELLEDAWELVREMPLAHVEAERHPPHLLARALPHLDEARDERDGQVVDAVEAEILEHLDGRALARAGETGDDDEPERLLHAGSPARRRPRLAISSSSRSAKSSALCRPRRRSRWLRAAVSISIVTLRPGRTGTCTMGRSTSRRR